MESLRGQLSVLTLCGLLFGGCVTITTAPQGQRVPAAPSDYEFTLAASPAEVFDALLGMAQSLNLSVDVLEKDSGFIQFKHSALSPTQLDQYCKYPVVKPGTDVPWDTFHGWNQRSTRGGTGSVSGSVSMNVLVTEAEGGTTAKLHSTWIASNRNETFEVSSLGILEGKFEAATRKSLGLESE